MAEQNNNRWLKGDAGWVCYRYADLPKGGTVVLVEVVKSEDRRGYMTAAVPGLFGGETFRCLVANHQIHRTPEEAEVVRRKLAKNWKPEDK